MKTEQYLITQIFINMDSLVAKHIILCITIVNVIIQNKEKVACKDGVM